MKSEEEILNELIKRLSGQGGLWFSQVPLGLKRYADVPPKYVADLIRVEAPSFEVYPRLDVKYWRRAMSGDPIYKDLNFNGKHVLIIEGKSVADYGCIGQVLVYKEAFKEDWPMAQTIELGIAANSFDAWVKETCDRLGIKTWIIDP
ncbi:MAG: hypothetical protein QXY46_05945 [Candidatus Bathyarchaeia archaeon]